MSVISMGEFRVEVEKYKNFVLTYDDVLSPMRFSVAFSHIFVMLSASPYISFRNGDTKMCLSCVESIRRSRTKNGVAKFIIACKDCSSPNAPEQVKFTLICY